MGILNDLFSAALVAKNRRGDAPLDEPGPDAQMPDGTPLRKPLAVSVESVPYKSAHAPVGGVTVGGTHYPGGQFIPGDVMGKATTAEKRAVAGGSEVERNPSFQDGSAASDAPQMPDGTPLSEPKPPLPPEASVVNRIDPALSPAEKIVELQRMTAENEPVVDAFLRDLDARFGTESKSNVKTPEKILAKASRPSIRAKKPWHDVEHIRDSFRFKTVLGDIRQLPEIVEQLEKGLGATVVKRDVDKFLNPGIWGWRIVAFDLQMPNGQLLEYYLPVEELEDAKGDGGNHHLFEKWRNLDETEMTPEQVAAYDADRMESEWVYQAAFDSYTSRMGVTEEQMQTVLEGVRAPSEAGKPLVPPPVTARAAGRM